MSDGNDWIYDVLISIEKLNVNGIHFLWTEVLRDDELQTEINDR